MYLLSPMSWTTTATLRRCEFELRDLGLRLTFVLRVEQDLGIKWRSYEDTVVETFGHLAEVEAASK